MRVEECDAVGVTGEEKEADCVALTKGEGEGSAESDREGWGGTVGMEVPEGKTLDTTVVLGGMVKVKEESREGVEDAQAVGAVGVAGGEAEPAPSAAVTVIEKLCINELCGEEVEVIEKLCICELCGEEVEVIEKLGICELCGEEVEVAQKIPEDEAVTERVALGEGLSEVALGVEKLVWEPREVCDPDEVPQLVREEDCVAVTELVMELDPELLGLCVEVREPSELRLLVVELDEVGEEEAEGEAGSD